MKGSTLAILIAAVALASVASAAEYYISPFGSDSNSGTSAHSAFLTLGQALSSSSTGDTINAANGYYTGSSNVGLTITDRTLVGDSTTGTVFQTDSGIVFSLGGTTNINSLTVKGSSSSTGISLTSNAVAKMDNLDFTSLDYGVALGANTPNTTVSSCSFDSSVSYGFHYSSTGSTVQWESIEIHDSTFATTGYAIYVNCGNAYDLSQFSVTDCVMTTRSYVLYYVGADLTSFERCTFSNITNSSGGGAIQLEGRSAFSVDDCVFTDNASSGLGGAIGFEDDTTTEYSSLTVTNSRFLRNSAGSSGGAIYSTGTILTVTDCFFAGNNGTDGGAVTASPYYNSAAAYIMDSNIFVGNYAASRGGAVWLATNSQPNSLSNSVFAFNVADSYGGAVFTGGGSFAFSKTSFIGNLGSEGGVLSAGDTADISCSSVSMLGNSATSGNGGAVVLGDDGTFTASGVSFSANTASNNGGALSMGTSTVSLQFVSFSKNDASLGGGFYASGTAAVNILGGLFTGNDATTSGGGFYCAGGGVNLGFVSFSGNDAPEGSAYTCSGNCGTYATNVYVDKDNDVYGCGSDSVAASHDEVEAMAAEHMAEVPTMTWEEAARILANVR